MCSEIGGDWYLAGTVLEGQHRWNIRSNIIVHNAFLGYNRAVSIAKTNQMRSHTHRFGWIFRVSGAGQSSGQASSHYRMCGKSIRDPETRTATLPSVIPKTPSDTCSKVRIVSWATYGAQ